MTYDDYEDESWNTEWAAARGDDGPTLLRVRSFCINNQSTWGYIGDLQEWCNHDAVVMQGCYDEPHWSDPVYYAT